MIVRVPTGVAVPVPPRAEGGFAAAPRWTGTGAAMELCREAGRMSSTKDSRRQRQDHHAGVDIERRRGLFESPCLVTEAVWHGALIDASHPSQDYRRREVMVRGDDGYRALTRTQAEE